MSSPFERPAPGRLPPLPSSLRRIVLWAVAAIFLAMVVVPWLASFFTDWLWFHEVHFESVFPMTTGEDWCGDFENQG